MAELTIAHPPVNALDCAGWHALAAAIERLGRDDAVHVIVLRGEGRGFCAGVDIKELGGLTRSASWRSTPATMPLSARSTAIQSLLLQRCTASCSAAALASVAQPTSLIAAECARFGVPEIDRGAMGGGAHLQRMFGVQKVRAMYFHRRHDRRRRGLPPGRGGAGGAAHGAARYRIWKWRGDRAEEPRPWCDWPRRRSTAWRTATPRGQVPLGAGFHACKPI
ncbi:enoyl-CoA hydratase-related protein [Cupriavidus basilensis]